MTYSRRSTVITRVQSILDALVSATSDFSIESPEPQKLSFKIREAINAARFVRGFDQYATLLAKFVIKAKEKRVSFELRVPATPIILKSLSTMRIENVTSLMEIVGAAIAHKAPQMHFPNALLSDEEYRRLYEWCNGNYQIIKHEEGLTLTKDAGELAWHPST